MLTPGPSLLAQPAYAIVKRRIYEDMKHIRLLLQNALRTSSDNHAIAVLVGLLHDGSRHLHHHIGIKAVLFCGNYTGGQRRAAHRPAIDSPQPRLHSFVESGHHARINVRGTGDRLNQFTIQKFPTQPLRNDLCNASAATSKFP